MAVFADASDPFAEPVLDIAMIARASMQALHEPCVKAARHEPSIPRSDPPSAVPMCTVRGIPGRAPFPIRIGASVRLSIPAGSAASVGYLTACRNSGRAASGGIPQFVLAALPSSSILVSLVATWIASRRDVTSSLSTMEEA